VIPRRERASDEIELADDDIIETIPKPRSGTYALSLPRQAMRPPAWTETPPPLTAPPEAQDVPVLESRSDELDTNISDLIGELALLSDVTRVPKLLGAVERSELDPCEEWLVSVVSVRMSVAAIMGQSPLGEEETLRLLARMLKSRVITLL
jgi:hypothetical protein